MLLRETGRRVRRKRRPRPCPARACSFCSGRIPDDEEAVRSKTGDAWAHFECWYDGSPFPRDPKTGRLL